MRTVHKIEGPVNIKPEGFDEKMAKKAKKLFWRHRKALMPPELAAADDSDDENNSEEKFAQNGLLDLSSSKHSGSENLKKSGQKTNLVNLKKLISRIFLNIYH